MIPRVCACSRAAASCAAYLRKALSSHRSRLELGTKRRARDVFHHDPRYFVRFADIVQYGDIRVSEGGGGSGFAQKTCPRLRRARERPVDNLYRDAAVQSRIGGGIDSPHPALAEFVIDAVCAEHRSLVYVVRRSGSSQEIGGDGPESAFEARRTLVMVPQQRFNLPD